jgi:2'-5' RNA ligase
VSPATESALVILTRLPDAIQRIRQRYDPAAALGVPPHVTIMYPFLPPAEMTGEVRRELQGLAGRQPRFTYTLPSLLEWPDGVRVLAAEPALPFRALTSAVQERWGLVPYEGSVALEEIVPHVTLGRELSSVAARQLVDVVASEKVIERDAVALTLLIRRGTWATEAGFVLAPTQLKGEVRDGPE